MNISAISLSLTRPGGTSLEQLVAALFSAGEQGAWYDPSGNNTTWRRNRLTRTEELANAAWSTLGTVTRTDNAALAPDNTLTATTALFVNGGGSSQLWQNPGAALERPLTASIWLRSSSTQTFTFGFYDNGSSTTSTIEVTTTWTQFVVTRTAGLASGSDRRACWLYLPGGGAGINVTIEIWHPQLEDGIAATAYQRIITPEITYLSTVQAQPLLFQDSAGTLPVTEVEQPVGLMLDRRKGLALGSELNDGLASASNWVAYGSNTVSESNGEITVTYVTTEAGAKAELNAAAGLSSNLVVGAWYKITGEAKINTGSALVRVLTSITWDSATISSTTFVPWTIYFVATSTTANEIRFGGLSTGEAITLRNISVKLLDGNHAYQTTSSARPHLRSRYNLLTYSEQFDNAAWTPQDIVVSANNASAPDGTTTADLISDNATSGLHRVYRPLSATSGAMYSGSVYVKASTLTYCAIQVSSGSSRLTVLVNLSTGAIIETRQKLSPVNPYTNIQSVGNGWYRVTLAMQSNSTGSFAMYLEVHCANSATPTWTTDDHPTYSGSGNGFLAWGGQFNLGSTAMSYQRIAATPTLSQPPTYATTSTMGGEVFRPYIEADGSDDVLVLASNPLTNATAATEVHGAWRPLGNAAGNGAVFGSFGSDATLSDHEPFTDDTWYSGFASTARQSFATISVVASPYILEQVQSGTTLAAYRNGTQVSTTKTVNFSLGTTPRVFASPATTTPFWRGRFYSGVVIGRVLSAAETTSLRSYVAGKTGVTL